MHTIQEQRIRSTSHLSLTHTPATSDSPHKPYTNGHLGQVTSPEHAHLPTSISFRQRLRVDTIFRRKVIHTVWLGWAFFFLGWSIGIFGPAFPDLRLLIHEDLETSTWLFTSGYFGYLVGSLIGGWLFDRQNKQLIIFLSTLGISLTNSLVPLCSSLWPMLVVMFFCGGFEGSLETGGNADIMATWGSEGSSYILAIYCAYSAGGIISPIVTQPFLASEVCLNPRQSNVSLGFQSNVSSTDARGSSSGVEFHLLLDNLTHLPLNNSSAEEIYYQTNINQTGVNTNESHHLQTASSCDQVYGSSNVHIPFFIAGVMSLTAAIPFFVLYCASRRNTREARETTVSRDLTHERPDNLPIKLKIASLVVISSIMFLYSSIEDNLTGLLMTFSISHLGWSKSHGSMATSLNWTAFAVGRFITIFLVRILKSCTILNIYFVILVISFIGFLVSSLYHVTFMVWIFIPLAGFALSVILPVLFSWTEECIVPVSGKISALYLVCGSAGSMLTPLMFGYLMEKETPMWYVHLLLAMCVTSAVLYGVTRVIVVCYIQPSAVMKHVDTLDTLLKTTENGCSLMKDEMNERVSCETVSTHD